MGMMATGVRTQPGETAGGYRLTDEQELLRQTVGRLADDRIAPRAAEIDAKAEFPWDVKELLAEHEILALPFAPEYGGVSGELLSLCLAIEQIARVCVTSSLILAVQALAARPIVKAGTEEQKRRWIPDLAAGKRLAAFALTEAGAGSDAAAVRTTARREGNEYVIEGSKRFITNGGAADLYSVFALTDPDAPKGKGISCFVVEGDSRGFSVPRLEHKMGIRGSPTAELLFDWVRVPADHLLGAEGQGYALALDTLQHSRPGIAAQAVGLAQGATDVALGYARTRMQFGKPIGEFQMVQAMLSDMATRTEAARHLLYHACVEIQAGSPHAMRWAAMAKLFAGDTAMAVTTDAVQVLGGYGYTADYPVERMMRDAKITQLYEGTQQIQRLVIARDLLGER
jgi:alkylation response protein AidB-like acyl-CoA dehydrogenase